MSELSNFFSKLFSKQATHYVLATIPTTHQDVPVEEIEILADKHYFRLWVSEMYLKDDRRLFREFVPVVHSAVSLNYGAGNGIEQELPYIAGPVKLGLGSELGKGVQVNHALTNLLPFRGGKISVAMGLVAYKSNDFFQGFVDVLSDVSGLFNSGQLSSTLKVVGSAVDGIQNLLGAGNKDIHLVYYEGFGGSTSTGGASFKSGYRAIIRTNSATFDKDKLYVKDSRLCYGDTLANAKPLDGFDYMLVRYEASDHRDDFMTFEQFNNLLKEAVKEGVVDRTKGDAIIRTATILAFTCEDLTYVDKLRVGRTLVEKYREAMVSSETAAVISEDMFDFNSAISTNDIGTVRKAAQSILKKGNLPIGKYLGLVESDKPW